MHVCVCVCVCVCVVYVCVCVCVCGVDVQMMEVLTIADIDKTYSLVRAKLKLLQVMRRGTTLESQLSSKSLFYFSMIDNNSIRSVISIVKYLSTSGFVFCWEELFFYVMPTLHMVYSSMPRGTFFMAMYLKKKLV